MVVRSQSEPASQTAPRQRDIRLDVLRGIAILLVLGRHNQCRLETAGWLYPCAWFLRGFGWSGVDLFFVLSGFLVGGLLLREVARTGGLDAWRFIIRRGLKIWPSYYVLLIVGVLGLTVTPHPDWNWTPTWFHVVSYGDPLKMPRGQLWSLSIEEHFYLLLPLLLIALTRLRRFSVHWLPFIAVSVMVACLIGRVLSYNGNWMTTYFPTHLRLDGLFMGVMLAYVRYFCPQIWERLTARPLPMLALGLALVLPVMGQTNDYSRFAATYGFTLLALGYACILVAFMGLPPFSSSFARVIAFIGFYSYSIYLWHFDVRYHIPLDWNWPLAMLIFATGSIAFGVVLGKLIELPGLAIRDRYFPSR